MRIFKAYFQKSVGDVSPIILIDFFVYNPPILNLYTLRARAH